ncbi:MULTISPECIES: hypothetical protein [Dyadobacter]|uniref:Uncharacterized protein n=1 Tax=Dyadobacter chenhuakuii TaxID=2909339 RepID=A0A9X1TUE4_9BACT|nr:MULTISPECIES: hypothetical protein [Dyadobacter]MCE7073584.1 hypothetical protein [Dyadobacter sp. CY327]MCF2499313.1 hypothetical protein [Dyadobacter chenhuakuii]
MKVLLDIKDEKATFVMSLLQRLPFVKTRPLSPFQSNVIEDMKEAVEQLNLVKAGKMPARDAEDLFNEL